MKAQKCKSGRIRSRCMTVIGWMIIAIAIGSGTQCEGFEIAPSQGGEGTIVRLITGREDPVDSIRFNNSTIAFQGLKPSFFFTVPFRAGTLGEKLEVEVSIEFHDGTSEKKLFNWIAGTRAAGLALSPPFAFRHAPNLAGEAVGRFLALILHGAGFNTSCSVAVEGNQMLAVLPGMLFTFPDNNEEIGQIFPEFDITEQGNTLVAIVPRAMALSGGDRGVTVTCGQSSAEAVVHFPKHDLRVEVDMADCCDWHPSSSELQSALDAISAGDVVLETRFDSPANSCPSNVCIDGDCCMTRTGIMNFLSHRDHESDLFDGQWYLHLALVGHLFESSVQTSAFGTLIDDPPRQNSVIFLHAVPSNRRLRTFLHEIGHALNLTHCERDAANNTLMVPSFELGSSPSLNFAGAALTHVQAHPENEVKPGKGQLNFNTAERVEGICSDGSVGDLGTIKLSLDADDQNIQIGESVVLWAKVQRLDGGGSLPALLSTDPAYDQVNYTISRVTPSADQQRTYRPMFHFDMEPSEDRVAGPIEKPVEISFGAAGATFKEPGDYRIVAEYAGHVSNPLLLHVGNIDSNCSADDVRVVLQEDVARFIYLKGGDPGAQVLPLLMQVSAHTGCRLSAVASYSLGKYFTDQGDVKSKEIGLAQLKKAREQKGRLPLEHQFGLYEQLVKTSLSVGDSDAAKSYFKEFKALVVESPPSSASRAAEYLKRSREYLGNVSDPP